MMMPRVKIAPLAMSFLLSVTTPDGTSAGPPLVAVEMETMQNTLDGCTACGCRVTGAIAPGVAQTWWFSFGLVKLDGEDDWTAAGSSSHCSSGSYSKISPDFTRTTGIPYFVLVLSMRAAVPPTGDAGLDMRVRTRKLLAFDASGEPVYSRSVVKRTLTFASEGDLTLPLLVADQREKESFRVESVVRMKR
jgi:hypothetical protein